MQESQNLGILKHIHQLKRNDFLGLPSACKMLNFDADKGGLSFSDFAGKDLLALV